MTTADLIDRLKAWARRYEPRSQERTLFLAAAEQIETAEEKVTAEVSRRMSAGVTVELVEKVLGSPLLPWQRKRLEEFAAGTPPASVGG